MFFFGIAIPSGVALLFYDIFFSMFTRLSGTFQTFSTFFLLFLIVILNYYIYL